MTKAKSIDTAEDLKDLLSVIANPPHYNADNIEANLIKHINKAVGTGIKASHVYKMIKDLIANIDTGGIDESQL